MKRGTLKDWIAAMSVVASTNPVHKLHALDGMLSMSANHNARMAQMAAEALEDFFLQTLLSPNRKLLSLDQRPLYLYEDGTKKLSPRALLQKFQLFLSQHILKTLQNGLEVNKLSALRTASALPREALEGEAQLLGMLVNKLGDPAKKIAAPAGQQLRLVLEQYVNMQTIIAREVSLKDCESDYGDIVLFLQSLFSPIRFRYNSWRIVHTCRQGHCTIASSFSISCS